jgi:hypothetical protein
MSLLDALNLPALLASLAWQRVELRTIGTGGAPEFAAIMACEHEQPFTLPRELSRRCGCPRLELDYDQAALLVARDAWEEDGAGGDRWRRALEQGIANERDPDSGLPAHDLIEWEWIFRGGRAARRAAIAEKRERLRARWRPK